MRISGVIEIKIGKRKVKKEYGEHRSMAAMPTPTGWGAELEPSKRKGAYRLERGEIVFERLFVRLLPEGLPPAPNNKDDIIGKKSKNLVTLPPQKENKYTPMFKGVSQDIAECRNRGDSDAVRNELYEQIRTLGFRMIACLIALVFLGLCEILPAVGVTLPDMFLPEKAPVAYLSLNLALGVFCLILCHSLFVGVWEALRNKKPDAQVVLAVAGGAAVLHCAAQLVYCIVKNAPAHRVFIAPMLLALLINDLGLLLLNKRVAKGFRFVALKEGKTAVRVISDDSRFDEINKSDRGMQSHAVYGVRANSFSQYIDYAFEEDRCEKMCSVLTPYVLLIALAAGVIGGLAGAAENGVWAGVYAFCAASIVCVPCARTLCLNLPLSVHTKKLLKKGVMLNGWAGVDEFGLTDTIVISDNELFPEGTLKLINFKPFGRDPVSDTVVYAASLASAVGGPIAQVFDDLIGRKRSRLKEADGLGYELGTGISGWVGDRPVLIGTRELLAAHGCDLPSKDYEEYIGLKGSNRKVVYVAVSGIPRAALCISYEPLPETVAAVQSLVASGVRLVVHSCDCNVTAQFVSRLYGIAESDVSILDMRFTPAWHYLTREQTEDVPALLTCREDLAAMIEGIGAAKNLRGIFMLSSVLHLVCFGLCLTLAAIICCVAPMGGITPAQIMLLQLICPLVSLVGLLQRI